LSDGEITLREILSAFHGTIEPVRLTWYYRLGLLCVTVAMVLLPLIYIFLIAGVIGLLIIHAIFSIGPIHRIHSTWVMLFAYVGPLVAGTILVFFMIKPLFAGRAKESRQRSLEVVEAPLLFALVSRVANAIGAPEPKRIDIDCEANASAGFGSVLGGFLGGDLVLTIGLPLLSELTIQQLAGVVAHELGHFSQGAGIRLSYVIRRINMWFHRVVFERDDWDQSLARTSEETNYLALIFLLARVFVLLTRCILGVLMLIGHGLSCFLLRQMEYDADRYEARLAGSDAFAETIKKICIMDKAAQLAFLEVVHYSLKDRLPDDFPAMVSAHARQVLSKEWGDMEAEMRQTTTGLFDSHPAYPDRLASAKKENAPGVFHLDGPASRLVNNFPTVSRNATRDLYRAVFGNRLKRMDVVPIAALHVDRTGPIKMSE
jgi:Zn-dependent protease with chaperone function